MQDDKPEQVENKTEETSHDFTVTITDETEMELVHDTVVVTEDSGEGDESADCILEDVLLIDSEDGIDEDTTLNNETDDDAKPRGINILLIMLILLFFTNVCLNSELRFVYTGCTKIVPP